MRVNAASLDIRDATTSTPGTLNDLTTDLIMANNNNNKEFLHIQADFCTYFKQSLLDSASSRLVEAVQGDLYWSSGLPPYLAATTKSQFYPERNELGSILESVRLDIMKEACFIPNIS